MVLLWRHSEQLCPSVLRLASWFRFERVTSCVMVLIFMFIFPMFASCTFILSAVCYFLFYFEVFPSALCVSSCFAPPSFALFPPHMIIPERFTCASLATSCVFNSAGGSLFLRHFVGLTVFPARLFSLFLPTSLVTFSFFLCLFSWSPEVKSSACDQVLMVQTSALRATTVGPVWLSWQSSRPAIRRLHVWPLRSSLYTPKCQWVCKR